MPSPPQKPKTPDDLAEVERALSVLQGRHPEHERARREDEAARARRAEALEAAAREDRRKRTKRLATMALGGVVLAGAVAGAAVLARKEAERRRAVDALVSPYLAEGFTLVESSSRNAPEKLEVQAPAACLLAVSSSRGSIRIQRPTGTVEGPGPLLFCLCDSEHLSITSDVAGDDGGMALLATDANALGGSRVFAFAPVKSASQHPTDQVCREATFDAWIDARKWTAVPGDEAWFHADPARETLQRAGLHARSVVPATAPFSVVEMEKESCLLAAAEPGSGVTRLAVRSKGGHEPIVGKRAIAFCAEAPGTVVVTKEGEGNVVILSASANRVGGTRGLRELARDANLDPDVAVAPADMAWNAKALLLASAIPEMLINVTRTPDLTDDPAARIVAIAMSAPSVLNAETEAEVFSYCDPPLGGDTVESLCAFSGKQKWRAQGADASGAIARAQLPFWLFALSPVGDPVALKVESQMITLARRLKHRGYEPTTLEALTELSNGVEILGRSGEDAVVAVAVAPTAPYAFPLSDASPWNLGDEPRAFPLAGMEKITLTTKTPLPSKATRRTVVFRRQKR